MKAEDTLNYSLKKYAGYKDFIEADENYDIPDDLSYMGEFIKTPEARKWLASLLLNCRNIERSSKCGLAAEHLLQKQTEAES